MKISRIKLTGMRNEEWFNFFTEFKTFVEQESSPKALDIEALFATFLVLYAQADKALEVLRKSSYTAEIVQLDGVRDGTYRGLTETVRAGLHHYSAPVREAAEKLEVIIDRYGNLSAKPYNEETAGIYNLLQDLRAKVNEVSILNLSGWLNELEANSQAFETAILARNAEEAGHVADVNMLEIRRQTDRCYLDIVERLEALMLIQGDAAFAGFVNKLNANIARYKNVLSRRGHHKEEKTD
jgi:hypothetical protein